MVDQVDQRPQAMLVTRNFPPLLGGMERLNQHLLESLAQTWRASLCGPSGASLFTEAAVEIREVDISPLSTFLVKSLWHSLRMAINRRPQWIVAGSGLMAPAVWMAARCSGAKAAVYLHGLDVIAPSLIYRLFWLPFIRHCDVVFTNSRATSDLALAKRVPSERITVVNPGTHLPMQNPPRAKKFRDSRGLGSVPLMLSVGRLTRRKGLAEFVARALPSIIAEQPDALLLVIGDEAKDALHGAREGERQRIMRIAGEAGIEKHVRFLGNCSEDDLHAAYEACDVHVFPVLSLPGDVEGFGMVALEAAAHGLPSVAFGTGGVPDAIEPGVTGALVMPGAYDELSAHVLHYLACSDLRSSIAADCQAFAEAKSWKVFARNILAVLGQGEPHEPA